MRLLSRKFSARMRLVYHLLFLGGLAHFLYVYRDGMADRLPFRFLEQGSQRDGDVGEHEEGEGEQILDLLSRSRMDVVPLCKGGERAEYEHEQAVVEKAEEHAGKRTDNHAAGRHIAKQGKRYDGTVETDGDDGKKHCGGNGHKHVVARESRAFLIGEYALQKLPRVMGEYLVEAFRPAEALIPRVLEGNGLLVVEHGGGAVADALSVDDGLRGKLDVFGEQVPLPAAVFFKNFGGNEESRARDGAAGIESQACLAEVFRFAQEPYGIAGGYPVASVVFGVAVAGGRNSASVIDFVHFAEIVHVQNIVRIEYEIGFVAAVCVALLDVFVSEVEGVPFSYIVFVETLENIRCSCVACNLGCVVGAVVGYDEDVNKLLGVVLHANAVNQIPDDGDFVSSRDHHGVTMVLLCLLFRRFPRKNGKDIEELIYIADGERQKDADIESVYECDL